MVDNYVQDDTTIYMSGLIDNYDPTTGQLALVIDDTSGYGLTDSFGNIASL
jgi:hypothetical protein